MAEGRHIAVIGAGIVGVATAVWLQRAGHRVTLIDRGEPGQGTSWGNGGVLAACSIVPVTGPGLVRKAPRMLLDRSEPLFVRWRHMPGRTRWLVRYLAHANAEAAERRAAAAAGLLADSLSEHLSLAEGTPAAKRIVPSDYVFAYKSAEAFRRDGFAWDLRARHGFRWEVLEGRAIAEYDPSLGPAVRCVVRLGGHGRIDDPGLYVADLARHLEAHGARLMVAEARRFLRENGRVTGVLTDTGVVGCDAAVLATGPWSRGLAADLGVDAPLESERGYHLELWEPNLLPRAPVMFAAGKFVATPMTGRLRLAGIVEFGGLDAPPARAPVDQLRRGIRAAMPGLTWTRESSWLGHRPSLVDSLPMIGAAPGLSGAFMGFGHDHVGLTGGAKTGRLLAMLAGGQVPNLDLSPFAPARFA